MLSTAIDDCYGLIDGIQGIFVVRQEKKFCYAWRVKNYESGNNE